MDVLLRVTDLGSFTAASTDLGLSHGAASAIVRDLETALGVQLLHRTTRRVGLTAEGEAYVARARGILSEIAALEDEMRGVVRQAQGRLRVAMPAGMARLVVAPALPGFLADHPALTVEIETISGFPDFTADRIDMGVFIGEPPDTGAVARTIGRIPFVCTAAPGYLARRGRPERPEDLHAHDCIGIRSSVTGRALEFRFHRDGRDHAEHLACRMVFEASEPAVAAAVAGGGCLMMIGYLVADEIEAGRLQQVLADWLYPGADILVVRPAHRLKPAKVAVFERFLVGLLRARRARWIAPRLTPP